MALTSSHDNSADVFINCRFDPEWNDNFEAIVFAVIACGFRVRCARETDDAMGTRVDKLYQIIGESRYGIHDLSCVHLDEANQLPRFNMPLELGLFLAAKAFGGSAHKAKKCLIMETQPHRYQMFISDLNGMDIADHNDDRRQMIRRIRNFLFTSSKRKTIPTAARLIESYDAFLIARPTLLEGAGHAINEELMFVDYERLVIAWADEDNNLVGQ